MKLKEVDRTGNVAWSPAGRHPIQLAVGTAAQQLDATFSTTALLELYSLNLGEPSHEMEVAGSLTTDS
jgi:protein transport protein SEC31